MNDLPLRCYVLSYLCELCFMVRNANDSIITSTCCTGISFVSKISISSQMLLDDSKLFLDLKLSHDSLDVINFGHFRQKGSDKNYTSLGSHRICLIYGFVFTSGQICSEDYLVIGSMVGTYFPMNLVSVHVCLGCIQVCNGFPSSTALHQMFHS